MFSRLELRNVEMGKDGKKMGGKDIWSMVYSSKVFKKSEV